VAVSTTKIREALLREFGKNVPLPDARRAVEKKLGLAPGRAISFDSVYFVAIGLANPLPAVSAETPKGKLALAIRRRRDGKDGASVPASGATKGLGLRRWETVAASASVALGRTVSVREARSLYGEKESYVGKGTRAAAPSTRKEIGV
jgi:hypothetical protein